MLVTRRILITNLIITKSKRISSSKSSIKKLVEVVEVIKMLVGRYESIQPWVGDLIGRYPIKLRLANEKGANFNCGSHQELEELNSTISTLSRLRINQINEIFNSVIMRLESDMN